MQFVRNGPDIPEQLLQAHEDGRVVFFCGAGVSYPAGLPGFGGLVDKIYRELGESPNEIEKAALKGERFDTALSLLESRVVGARPAVRKAIAAILTPNLALPRATQTHEALLTLSKNGQGQFRLITTNFDRLFEEAKVRMNFGFSDFRAPLLPVPKKKWDGLVYLHGFLPETPRDGDLDRLVVSSGDFGLAYLTERWAARFVSELFRNFTICFVGYSINDPVMRYMMDALAADRLLGEAPLEVFAFGNYARGKEQHVINEWGAKNVTPILYSNHNRHAHLHGTLLAWAKTYRDGIRGKESIVARHAATRPIGSTRQDNFVGRILWALSDPSGLPAKLFADYNPVPTLDWLEAFSELRFGHRDLDRFGVRANEAEDKKLKYSLISRPASYTASPWMRLVRGSYHATQWDKVMPQIARWLARHLDDPKLVLWVAERGGRVDETFEHFLSQALDRDPPSALMTALWRIVISGRLSDGLYRRNLYDWGRRLAKDGLTPLLKWELREILSPCIRIRDGYRWRDNGEEPETERERVKNAIDWEIVLQSQFVHSAIESLARSENWQIALPELLTDATDLLTQALDLMRQLQSADDHSDRSLWHQPSISPHPQNRNYHDWTALIDLARDSWVASAQTSPEKAIREVDRWLDIPYPVFKRLVFFAAVERPDLFPMEQIVSWLLLDNSWWLWTTETQRETMRLIIALAPDLPPKLSEVLQNAIIQGLPAEIIGDEREPEQAELLQQREIWRRLSAFNAAGGVLLPPATKKLAEIAIAHPQWEKPDEQDEFPVWMGTGDDWKRYSATPQSRRELEVWLRENPAVDDIHHDDDFRERCRSDFPRSLLALLNLARGDEWIIDRWRQALQAWSDESLTARSWRCLNGPLSRAPAQVIKSLDHQIGYWLRSCAKAANIGKERSTFFILIRKLLEAHSSENHSRDNDPLTAAINNPVGHVTEAALSLWYAQGLEDNQGLDDEFEPLFTEICKPNIPSFRHGRLLLCTHAITLFRVDRDWTARHLLPQFDWSRSTQTALAAWTGFLWSPRLYWPLLAAMKLAFLETAAHYDELGDIADQYVALMTFGALERTEFFAAADFSRATATLPARALPRVVQALKDGLESSGERRNEYWQNRIKPYMKFVWPKSLDGRTAAVSEQIARLMIAAGDDFPDALNTLGSWLLPFEDSSHALHQLSESELGRQFPESALDFLDKIVGSQAMWSATELRNCLSDIKLAQPNLVDDQRFTRLETIVRQSGHSL